MMSPKPTVNIYIIKVYMKGYVMSKYTLAQFTAVCNKEYSVSLTESQYLEIYKDYICGALFEGDIEFYIKECV